MGIGLFVRCALALAGCALVAAEARAVYTCVDAKGRKTMQQMPCPVEVLPAPPPKPKAKLTCDLGADQLRRVTRLENQFLTRFPDEASHRRAQLVDLEQVVDRIRVAHERFAQLAAERKPLDKERAFYEGKPLPAWLKAKIDASDAQFAALTDILRGHEQNIGDIQARYQCERDTYGKLWADAAPGSSACDRPACAAS